MLATQILTRDEVATVLDDLNRRILRSPATRLNLVIFRLSACCGLRRGEMCGLSVGDVVVSGARPAVVVPKQITKGGDGKRRTRVVPLWWDRGTLDDLRVWRECLSADPRCPFISSRTGRRFRGSMVAKRWRTAIKCLGPARVAQLSVHSGRHSFCSHALAAGRSLVEVRDAAGHRNISTTSLYLHAIESNARDLFPVFLKGA